MLNAWFENILQTASCGVLVSHNTATDIQFLSAEYIRAGMKLPDKVNDELNTLDVLKRFSSLCYRKVDPDD